MKVSSLILSMLFLGLSGCSTVTITDEAHEKLTTRATYEESVPFYLWGLMGDQHVDVLEICNNKEPIQMQTLAQPLDGFLGVMSFGLYYPHTVKVWCPKEES